MTFLNFLITVFLDFVSINIVMEYLIVQRLLVTHIPTLALYGIQSHRIVIEKINKPSSTIF